jgi:uncharacterized protein YbaR (Trm112 family)
LFHKRSGADSGGTFDIVPGYDLSTVKEAVVPVDPELLEILVCPECHESVQPVHEGTGLKCPICRRVYPVGDDGIPVMLLDEAKVED